MRKVTKPIDKEAPKTLGERIEFKRTEQGISQSDLADVSNVSRNYLSMIESNKRIPNIYTLAGISKHLGVSSDYLLCLSDIPSGNADDMALEKKFNLTEKAITKIHQFNMNDVMLKTKRGYMYFFNRLLCNPNFGTALSALVSLSQLDLQPGSCVILQGINPGDLIDFDNELDLDKLADASAEIIKSGKAVQTSSGIIERHQIMLAKECMSSIIDEIANKSREVDNNGNN